MSGTPDPPYQAGVREPWVRLRSVPSGPFVYRRMVAQPDPVAAAGDVVAVLDRGGRLIGRGFYHDRSQISVRMLAWDETPVDERFFSRRIAAALEWRKRLLGADLSTNACRLVHAEGDGLSGLIVERYGDFAAFEIFSLGVYRRLEMFKRLLAECGGPSRFVVRADRRVEQMEGFTVDRGDSDPVPETVEVREHGVRYRVDLRAGHKTGFFCDQRDNRRRLAGLCAGARVLDVCCYTGGFGICAALLGQAAAVTGIDLDEQAVALARRNAKLNQVHARHVHADAFGWLRQARESGRRWDVIVLDPPKFVPTRDEIDEGTRKYADLNAMAMSVLEPGGLLLTCSCSGLVGREHFTEIVAAAARRARRPLQILDRSGAAPDHPIMADCPESEYLKALWTRLP